MIAFHPDGTVETRRHIMCSCLKCSVGKISECSENRYVEDIEIADELQSLDEDTARLAQQSEDMYVFVENGSYVAVCTTAKSLEHFIVCKVDLKGVAAEDLTDFYGHIIQQGDTCFRDVYLEKVDQKKRDIHCKMLRDGVCLDPAEVFCPAVAINPIKLTLPIADYLFLCDCLKTLTSYFL